MFDYRHNLMRNGAVNRNRYQRDPPSDYVNVFDQSWRLIQEGIMDSDRMELVEMGGVGGGNFSGVVSGGVGDAHDRVDGELIADDDGEEDWTFYYSGQRNQEEFQKDVLRHWSDASPKIKESDFFRRECIVFVPKTPSGANRDTDESSGANVQPPCVCGRSKADHESTNLNSALPETPSDTPTVPFPKPPPWSMQKCTSRLPTNAFGSLNFVVNGKSVGFGNRQKKFIRIAAPEDLESREGIDFLEATKQLLVQKWKLGRPSLILSITGGAKDFKIPPKITTAFQSSIERLVQLSPRVWLVTGGTHTGVMKLVGKAFKNFVLTRIPDEGAHRRPQMVCLGVAPWGVVHHRQRLVDADGGAVDYEIDKGVDEGSTFDVSLDPNHSHFLLSDDGRLEYGADIGLRAKLEEHVANTVQPGTRVPLVAVLLEGGPGSLKTVAEGVSVRTPCIVVAGTGRAADVIVETDEMFGKFLATQEGSTVEEFASNRSAEIREVLKRHKMDIDDPSKLLDPLYKILRNREYLHVFAVDDDDSTNDLAKVILHAVLVKAEREAAGRDEDEAVNAWNILWLAFRWNRIATARTILGKSARMLDNDDVFELFNQALIMKRCGFLELLLGDSNVFPIKEYSQSPKFTQIFGYLANRKQFDQLANWAEILDSIFRRKIGDFFKNGSEFLRKNFFGSLFVWALLRNDFDVGMAVFFLMKSNYPIAHCLIACNIFRKRALRESNDQAARDMEEQALSFEQIAANILEKCYRGSDVRAKLLLVRELLPLGRSSVVQLAIHGNCKNFISHQACQELFQTIWLNQIPNNLGFLRFFACMLCPPLALCLLKKNGKYQAEEEFVAPDFRFVLSNGTGTHQRSWSIAYAKLMRMSSLDRQESVRIASSSRRAELKDNFLALTEIGIDVGFQASDSAWTEMRRFCEAPVVKFYWSLITYVIFLAIFATHILQPADVLTETHFSAIEIFLFVFWLNFLCQEIFQVFYSDMQGKLEKVKEHFESAWNILDSLIIGFMVLTLTLRIAGLFLDETFEEDDVSILVKMSYSALFLLFCIRILAIYTASPLLGPKLVMIKRMVADLFFFMSILMVFVISYGIVCQSLFQSVMKRCHQGVFNETYSVSDIFSEPYWNLMGELGLDRWLDLDSQRKMCIMARHWLFPGLQAIYLLISSILLLNLLIAMFSQTFSEVQEESLKIWAFNRHDLILEYRVRSALPQPIALIEFLFRLIRMAFGHHFGSKKIVERSSCLKLKLERNLQVWADEGRWAQRFAKTLKRWEFAVAQRLFHAERERLSRAFEDRRRGNESASID